MRRPTPRGLSGLLVSLFLGLCVLALGRAARAQTAPPAGGETGLARVLGGATEGLVQALRDGHEEFFRLVENLELFNVEREIDRFVGDPHELNDATSYKLSLLPFNIRYPIYRQLVDQMTRLDTVRSRPIHMVTPNSVALVDLRLPPVLTLDAFQGEGVGPEVERSLLRQFTARETADLTVFFLAQQAFFPEDERGWERVKHRVARGAVPLALAALATGAAFDAGALAHSQKIVGRSDDLRLRWYAGFRDLGIHWHPSVRGGLALHAFGFQAAAGVADQIRPAATQPDRALELALREGWLNQLAVDYGWDAFFEAALRTSLQNAPGFVGPNTTTRAGFFFKRDELPGLPHLSLRGSAEVEGTSSEHLHPVAALGVQNAATGITTVVQVTRLPAAPEAGSVTEDRLNLFFVGSTDPLSAYFETDMIRLARRSAEEWEGLRALNRRRQHWEQSLLTGGAASRTPEQMRATLGEMEQILAEREERVLRLAEGLADYLEARRRTYTLLKRGRAEDELHGPLDAAVLVAARDEVIGEVRALAAELESALVPLLELRERIGVLTRQVRRLEATDPGGGALAERRRALALLEDQWDRETERVHGQLAAREQLCSEGKRMLRALGKSDRMIHDLETLALPARRRLAWLSFSWAR